MGAWAGFRERPQSRPGRSCDRRVLKHRRGAELPFRQIADSLAAGAVRTPLRHLREKDSPCDELRYLGAEGSEDVAHDNEGLPHGGARDVRGRDFVLSASGEGEERNGVAP